MKRVICDACRQEGEQDSYGIAPNGWFSIVERGKYPGSFDYCSRACVIAAMQPSPISAVEQVIEAAERVRVPA